MNGIRSGFVGVLLAAGGLVAGSSLPGAQQAREVGLADLPPELLETLHWMFPPTEGAVRGAGFGDVDGDGDPDLILLAREGNQLFLDDGDGGFELAAGRLPAAASRRSVALAFCDVEGDGDLDLFLANTVSSSQLLLNDGAGRFTDVTATRFPVSVGVASSVAVGDVDGDLDLDLLIGRTGQNLLYLNDGLGFFADASSGLPALLDLTLDVVLGDVEGDGDLDAFVANSSGGVYTDAQNRLLLNNGSGVFVEGTAALPVDADQSLAAALADLDGDDLPDVVVANEGLSRLYLNDGAGGFLDATASLPGALDPSYGVELGDVDGDGDLDVVFANNQLNLITHARGAQNRLLLNDGAATFQEATSQLASVLDETHAVRLADVDGDGDLDLFAANEDPSLLQLNAGDGTFLVAGSSSPFRDVTNVAALGDVDGDGDPDVVTGNGSPASMFYPAYEPENRLYLNTAGRFVEAPGRLPLSTLVTTSVALGDVDGDGDLDALMGNPLDGDLSGVYLTQENNLYLNQGAATFVDATANLPTFPGEERGVTLGVYLADMDGDGDLDILLAKVDDYDGGGGGCGFYRNVGAAQFVDASLELPDGHGWNVEQVAIGDLDRDGRLDLVTASNPAFNGNMVLLRDGTGGFVDASTLLPRLDYSDASYAVSLGDVDADGDLEIFIGNVSGPDRLYVNRLNTAVGAFTDEPLLLPERVARGRFVDLDHDGFPELIGTDNLLFNARGVFLPAGELLPGPLPDGAELVFGDVDQDGDLDGLVSAGSVRIWSNLTRHVAWRNVPRIGKPLVIDVFGPRSEPWLLLLSGGTRVTHTPFGLLQLDPSGLQRIGGGLLPADGRAAPLYAVPADPTLVGQDFYLQAAVGSKARLTNLEVVTFTDL